jgi:hypothetical protein
VEGVRVSRASRHLAGSGSAALRSRRRARVPDGDRGRRLLVSADRPLAPLFVYSLVPIALAYAIAHYFSLAYYQGQWAVRLASDPLGRGWDLFGSADYAAQAHTLSPNTIWYVQVAALVCGHVIALALAHDRAVATFQTVYGAILAQFSLLALMVLYTVGGLWILSQG